MKSLVAVVLSALLFGCASAPTAMHADQLFNDRLFGVSSEKVDPQAVFAINDRMREYVKTTIAEQSRTKGPQQALFDALYIKSQLRLEYDSEMTRNAIEAFDARSGNCLSMAIMTAALAKEMGLSVKYRSVFVNEAWSRSGGLYLSAGHVNVTLVEKSYGVQYGYDIRRPMTIDFIPLSDVKNYASEVIDEDTILAMYMNNRAAESLAEGKLDNAYWWARGAITQNPEFMASYNTLGAIYRGHGNVREAEFVFGQLLERTPKEISVLFNMAQLLKAAGRFDEANVYVSRMEQIRPHPPYYFFDLGQVAMKKGDFKEARDLFTKEVERAPESSEFNFWLAAAYFNLGEIKPAGKYMALAMENSTSRADHSLYAAKLSMIKAKQRAVKLD